MGSVLGSIFGFGDKLKRRLKDVVSNPSDYAEMTADENRNEWRKNPDERSMGFFNPVPMGTMGNFVLRKGLQDAVEGGTDLSRREFMKKSAGLAGGTAAASIPGSKLLQKFAPEERAVAKQAAVETAPKYKYNSLKEYLDDVTDYSHDVGHERAYESAMENGYNNHPGADRYMDNFIDNFDFSKIQRERLLEDEQLYNHYKQNPEIDPFSGRPHHPQVIQDRVERSLNAFSPQAKQEMKALKSLQGNDWVHEIQSPEFRYYLDNSGVIRGKPQYRGDHTLPPNEFYWNGKTPMDTQYEHLNPKTGGFNFWDETGGHGLSEGTNTLEELQRILKNYNP